MPSLALFRRRQAKAANDNRAAPATPSRLPLPAAAGKPSTAAASAANAAAAAAAPSAEERSPLFPPHPAVRLPDQEPRSGVVGSSERRSLIPVPVSAPMAGKAKEETPARKGISKDLEDDLQKAADELEEQQLTPRALKITKTPSTGRTGVVPQTPQKAMPPTPTPAQRTRVASPHANLLLGGRRRGLALGSEQRAAADDDDAAAKDETKGADKALPPPPPPSRPASAASTAAQVAAQAPTNVEIFARMLEMEGEVRALAAIVAGRDASTRRLQDAALESANAANFAEEKATSAEAAALEALEMARMTTTMVENLVLGGGQADDETF